MIVAHCVREVREAETALMARVPDGTLMQRAATGLAVTCLRLLGQAQGRRAVLLVGGGDNGGDTLYAGARLARRGVQVQAVLLAPSRTHRAGLAALRASGGRVLAVEADSRPDTAPEAAPVKAPRAAFAAIEAADIVLDGIVGIGGSPGLRPPADALAEAAHRSSALVVAVDLPSGVDVDTGRTPSSHVHADVTVTFGTRKICHLVDPAAHACGEVHLVDIGLGPWLPEVSGLAEAHPVPHPTATAPAHAPTRVEALQPRDVADLLGAYLVPGRQDDKYRRGVLGLHVGAFAYAGASVLAASAAVGGGIGMLRVQGDEAVCAAVRDVCPEVVLADGRVQAWLAGPGMEHEQAIDIVPGVLAQQVPALLDAGALSALPPSGTHETPLRPDVLLTPHAGEAARLLATSRDEVERDRLASVQRAAAEFGATVLLKGSTTLVASPHGQVRANPTGTPWLATAGSGDVLAGLAGALLAAGMPALDAGSVAAYVHGYAGRLAATRCGSPSARDVAAALPDALLASRLGQSLS